MATPIRHPTTGDCIGAWHMDQPVVPPGGGVDDLDITGHGHLAVCASSPPGPWPGTSGLLPFGVGSFFRAPFDYAYYSITDPAPFEVQTFTIAWWLGVGQPQQHNRGTIFRKTKGGSQARALWAVFNSLEQVYFQVYFGSIEYAQVGPSPVLPIGGAYHITVTFDGAALRLYVDNTLVDTATTTLPYVNPILGKTVSYGSAGGRFDVGVNPFEIGMRQWFDLEDLAWYEGAKDQDWINYILGNVTFDVSIENIFVVARDVIRLDFTGAVAVTHALLDPTSYVLATGIRTDEVLPLEDRLTRSVFLKITPKAEFGTDYQLTIPSGTIYNPNGILLAETTAAWTHHRTKVDTVLASLAGMYDKKVGSNLRTILQSIMVSDEEIGGDF